MKRSCIAVAFVVGVWTTAVVLAAEAAPCLLITLTGTQSGPAAFNAQAGAGTLIRFGDDSNACGTVKLLVDAGRGTNMRLSQLDVTPVQLNAVFFTHMHSDHTEGFADIMFHRWAWDSRRPTLDVVCSADVASQFGFTVSCQKFVAHIGDAFLQSGEIAQRRVEGGGNVRLVGGPAELANLITFKATEEPQVVWSLDDVKVSAIRSTHIPGHSSYRVDTPAGSAVRVKLPVAVVVVWETEPFSEFLATTTAPGTMALAGSVTVPVMVPRSVCANDAVAKSKATAMRRR